MFYCFIVAVCMGSKGVPEKASGWEGGQVCGGAQDDQQGVQQCVGGG